MSPQEQHVVENDVIAILTACGKKPSEITACTIDWINVVETCPVANESFHFKQCRPKITLAFK